MIQFTGRLYTMQFDAEGFKKSLQEAIAVQMRQAARAWLRAVIPAVPVYTGMARGSLQPLGRILRVAVPISPIAFRRGKSPAEGATQSSFEFYNNGSVWTFSWSTDVLHYTINEYNNMSGVLPLRHPTPWKSIEKGNIAFNAYMEANISKRIPKLADYIKTDTVQVRS